MTLRKSASGARPSMSAADFNQASRALRARSGRESIATDAARSVLVDGATYREAATAAGCNISLVWRLVSRIKAQHGRKCAKCGRMCE